MSTALLALLALSMSMDAFAAALAKGVAPRRPRLTEALRTALIFGAIETVTPLAGWLLGAGAVRHLRPWEHWIAFGLLLILGMRMIRAGWTGQPEAQADKNRSPSFRMVAVTAFATSIDGMAAGASLAFLKVNILSAAATLGLTTALIAAVGVTAGQWAGADTGKRAMIAGGMVLICIGMLTVAGHLGERI